MLAGMPVAPADTPPTAILVNLDLDRTNLIRSPDWPILISNVIEMRRQSLPGPERWNYRTGEWVRARLDRDPTGPLSFRCGTVERALPASRQLEFIAPSPGGLLQVLEGDRVLFELGVNFLDEEETRLAGLATADTGELASAPGCGPRAVRPPIRCSGCFSSSAERLCWSTGVCSRRPTHAHATARPGKLTWISSSPDSCS